MDAIVLLRRHYPQQGKAVEPDADSGVVSAEPLFGQGQSALSKSDCFSVFAGLIELFDPMVQGDKVVGLSADGGTPVKRNDDRCEGGSAPCIQTTIQNCSHQTLV
jgi:hypothetical protein